MLQCYNHCKKELQVFEFKKLALIALLDYKSISYQ